MDCGRSRFVEPAIALAFLAHDRDRQERREPRAHADRARARPAAAVRRGERLVQVHVDDVEAHVARAHLAEDRVEVRAVVVQQAAGLVHDARDLLDAALEHAERGGIGEHDAGGLRADRGLQRFEVDVAVRQSTGISRTTQPHIVAVAGFVPCAASGTMISVRARSPRAR